MAAEIEPDGSPNPLILFPLQVECFYAALIRHCSAVGAGLGGRLLYVVDLDEDGRGLMVAANIAGAASLASTADHAAQKQAIRDGVADFLVTSLDEALRILKNEIRKGEAVAVCVAAAPEAMEKEMVERGVLPDLIGDIGAGGAADLGLAFGGIPALVAPLGPAKGESLLSWSVDESPARWLPQLDAIAMECVASDESLSAQIARRWLRFAPRYLGRLARNVRVLRCSMPTAEKIAERMRTAVKAGEIPVPVRIEVV
jgi:urocanate hydratase